MRVLLSHNRTFDRKLVVLHITLPWPRVTNINFMFNGSIIFIPEVMLIWGGKSVTQIKSWCAVDVVCAMNKMYKYASQQNWDKNCCPSIAWTWIWDRIEYFKNYTRNCRDLSFPCLWNQERLSRWVRTFSSPIGGPLSRATFNRKNVFSC